MQIFKLVIQIIITHIKKIYFIQLDTNVIWLTKSIKSTWFEILVTQSLLNIKFHEIIKKYLFKKATTAERRQTQTTFN